MQTVHDPSTSSYYVNEQLYQELVTSFTDWQRDDLAVHNLSERDQFRILVEKEARLLDQLRFDEWLAMYAPECIYWVPATPQGGDPRREVAILFDDRRRMEDRIYRLRTGYAWSQAPKSRTILSSSPKLMVLPMLWNAARLRYCATLFSNRSPRDL